MTDPVDEALAYAAKWNQTPPTAKGMNYHMQVLAGEVERRRALDGLVAELVEHLRFYGRRWPGAVRKLVLGKLNLYDAATGRVPEPARSTSGRPSMNKDGLLEGNAGFTVSQEPYGGRDSEP